MKSKKSAILMLIGFLTGFGVYNLLVFTIAKEYSKGFWVAYAFTVIAFLIQAFLPLYLCRDEGIKRSSSLGIPLIVFSIIYFAIQMIAGVLLMCFKGSVILNLVIGALILAGFIWQAIASLSAVNYVTQETNRIKDETNNIYKMTMIATNLYNEVADEEEKKLLKKVVDALQFADPISSTEEIKMLDANIMIALNEISEGVKNESADTFKAATDKVVKLVSRRNKLCALSK